VPFFKDTEDVCLHLLSNSVEEEFSAELLAYSPSLLIMAWGHTSNLSYHSSAVCNLRKFLLALPATFAYTGRAGRIGTGFARVPVLGTALDWRALPTGRPSLST
jgi:hypothetical protein